LFEETEPPHSPRPSRPEFYTAARGKATEKKTAGGRKQTAGADGRKQEKKKAAES
jgi:hypothetical protein